MNCFHTFIAFCLILKLESQLFEGNIDFFMKIACILKER